jgi:hypothetical protein
MVPKVITFESFTSVDETEKSVSASKALAGCEKVADQAIWLTP